MVLKFDMQVMNKFEKFARLKSSFEKITLKKVKLKILPPTIQIVHITLMFS